jgi:hypothetical protein
VSGKEPSRRGDTEPDRATVGLQGVSPEEKPMSVLNRLKEKTEEKRPKGKVQQVVWLEPNLYAKVYEFAKALGLAPNKTIELMVEDYILSGGDPTKPRYQVVEKVKERELVWCPECLKKFPDVSAWREHLRENPQELRNLIKDLMELLR